MHLGPLRIAMKTPRHEQPWYEHRLEHNSKPGPMSAAERAMNTLENRRILDEAPRLIAYGIKQGWIKLPPKAHKLWHNDPETSSSIERTHESPLL